MISRPMNIFGSFALARDDHGLRLPVRVMIIASPLLELRMIVDSHVLVHVTVIDSASLVRTVD
jgi:hypothetical protein